MRASCTGCSVLPQCYQSCGRRHEEQQAHVQPGVRVSCKAHLMCVHADRYAKHAGQAKVSKLDQRVLVVDKDVLWLQITMQDPAALSVLQAWPS